MSTGWDEAEFAKRVSTLAHARGMSVTAVMRQAGLTGDFLAHPPRSGRRIDSITRIARVLQVSVSHLVGDDEPPVAPGQAKNRAVISLVANIALYLASEEYASNGESPDFRAAQHRMLKALIDGLGAIVAANEPPQPETPPEPVSPNPPVDQAADS